MPHTILIVEDNTNIRRFIRTTLEIEGYRALEASTVQESVEHIDRERPDFVLLDLALPDGSGWEFIAAARSHADAETRRLPIVVLTASADHGMSERAIAAGATAFLTKPISAADLMENVRRALAAGAPPGGEAGPFAGSGQAPNAAKGRGGRQTGGRR